MSEAQGRADDTHIVAVRQLGDSVGHGASVFVVVRTLGVWVGQRRAAVKCGLRHPNGAKSFCPSFCPEIT